MESLRIRWLFGLAGVLLCVPAAWADESKQLAEALSAIRRVKSEGQGNRAAQAAVRELTAIGSPSLLPILEAFDGANPLAANWLRGAFEAIAEKELRSGRTLPAEKLEAYVKDRSHDPRARRLAFEWLTRVDQSAYDRLVPGMLQDPSPELRREAVAMRIKQAERLREAGQNDQAVRIYRQALAGATDRDQVEAIVGPLRELGEKVDLQRHFGFLTRWWIIGPFDNREGIGFDAVYPPERQVDLNAVYDGQLGKVRWSEITTDHEYGIIDIARQLQNWKGSCVYVATEFVSGGPRSVEFRLGTPNAWKLWLNGQLLFAREEYHRGMALDQYRVAGRLRAGKNLILLKICQNEQTQDWAQRYQFQFRVTDASGVAVLSADREVAALGRNRENLTATESRTKAAAFSQLHGRRR